MNTYITEMQAATALLRVEEIAAGVELLRDAARHGRGVYLFGNGGSAATASHMAVDLGRTRQRGSGSRMRVMALTDNVPWLTAVSNDQSYDACFADQLDPFVEPGDLVVAISASGDSENVVRAFDLARDRGAHRLALIGFDGGRLARLATSRIWVDSHDYGIVESVHLFVVHLLAVGLAGGELRETPERLPRRRSLQRGHVEPDPTFTAAGS